MRTVNIFHGALGPDDSMMTSFQGESLEVEETENGDLVISGAESEGVTLMNAKFVAGFWKAIVVGE